MPSAADRAMQFAADMLADGLPTVVIYIDKESRVRMATPALPGDVMARMLNAALDSYAARERGKLN